MQEGRQGRQLLLWPAKDIQSDLIVATLLRLQSKESRVKSRFDLDTAGYFSAGPMLKSER